MIEEEAPPELSFLDKVKLIPGLEIAEIVATDHFGRIFEIYLDQPVDHNEPNGASFKQKIFLSHVNEEKAVIFETEGYSRVNHRTRELAARLRVNQLAVEHRFYGSSIPNPKDWTDLTVWQAAQDLHRIVELFKPIYSSSWISSGTSKGGDTAIFHRRFFPDDVIGTVAYVAPILFEKYDQRFLSLQDRWGSETCRQKLRNYQRSAILNLDALAQFFPNYIEDINSEFGLSFRFSLAFRDIVYNAIREDYPFEFWSSETETCNSIPEQSATPRELFDHFVSVFNIFLFFSDFGVGYWTPYTYQALTELGNYAVDRSHLEDLQRNIPDLVSFETVTDFNPSIMADVDNWLKTEARDIVLIYGASDPWTIAAIDMVDSESNLKIVSESGKHSVRIANLSQDEQQRVDDRLMEWIVRSQK